MAHDAEMAARDLANDAEMAARDLQSAVDSAARSLLPFQHQLSVSSFDHSVEIFALLIDEVPRINSSSP